ncbi:reelin domain-containing protein 1-like isoform X1 [Chiloscyllium plagiosum]|uniref:reelin domain-containing protein 1-like isoform X1 n=1 Tax=Chiloscyllium plagiosum TaxID=36176 RepID=UPI001CB88A25|nr:reelin domain-containing protein 1-like isoform X1 [Chiloscyllium plagiosum]
MRFLDQKALMFYIWLIQCLFWKEMPTKILLKMLRSHMVLLVWMLGILCLVSFANGFSHGASTSACTDMKPKHIGAHPQDLRSNFMTVYTDKTTYLPGEKLPVTVRSTQDFMGFFMQARRVVDDQVTGTFILTSSGSKLMKCSEDGDTVTHSDKSLKRNLSFIWKAPEQLTGDIKFFVSAVQSYFIYWTRIESGLISDQKQNYSISTQNDELKETFQVSAYNSTTARTAASFEADYINPQTTSQMVQELSQTPLITADWYLRPQAAHAENSLPELTGYSQDHSPSTSQSSLHQNQNERRLQPSLNSANRHILTGIQILESSLLLKTTGFKIPEGEDTLNSDFHLAFQTCMNCNDIVQVSTWSASETDSEFSAALSLPIKTGQQYSTFWFSDFPPAQEMDWAPADKDTLRNPGSEAIPDSGLFSNAMNINPTLTENQLTPHRASANLLQLVKNSGSRTDLGKVARNMSLGVTQSMRKESVTSREGSLANEAKLRVPQLGMLLGCSAALGMALAVGLRHFLSQYCRKHTEVSFGNPDSSIISVGESGELVHVRKIRENSFVLVQAEYNVITPSSTGGK